MPRELLHWRTVAEIAAGLGGTPIGQVLDHHRGLANLGAVAHDTFYFVAASGAGSAELRAVADKLHGTAGEDTFALLSDVARRAHLAESGAPCLAFLVGLLSHVFLDAALHPWVYYTTGSIYDPDPSARRRAVVHHRRLETIADIALAGRPRPGHGTFDPVPVVRREARLLTALLCDLIDPAHGGPIGNGDSLAFMALRFQARVHRLTAARLPAAAASFAYRLAPTTLRQLLALFYWRPTRGALAGLRGDIVFRHPVSGEPRTTSLEALVQSAVEHTLEVCRSLLPDLERGAPLRLPDGGPSLELGPAGGTVDRMRYFAHAPPHGA